MKRILSIIYKYFIFKFIHPTVKSEVFIHPRNNIGKYVVLKKCCIHNSLSIGDYTFIHNDVNIGRSVNSIGKFTSIATGVRIGLLNHPIDIVSTSPVFYNPKRGLISNTISQYNSYKGVSIGNDVWIGTNALILDNVTIGDGAIIAAGSVVTKNVEPYAVVGGCPAKVLKYRFDKSTISDLLKIKWWDLDQDWIERNTSLFLDLEVFLDNFKK